MNYLEHVRNECIDCGLCTKNCPFLSKYNINLAEYTDRNDLAFSCFECNKCASVCPKHLNGKYVSKALREKNPSYKFVKINKDSYIFKNPPKAKEKSKDFLYLGCNFPAFYPETSQALIDIFKDHGFDFSIDCCRKPIASTGYPNTHSQSLDQEIEKLDIDRIVTVCPNCYHFMQNEYKAEVISIYDWLDEYNLIQYIDDDCNVFFPCSDRYNRKIFDTIKKNIRSYNDKYTSINCCGSGGLASKKESEIAEAMTKAIKDDKVYTYCATCSMRFAELNEVHHFLSVFLGIDEKVKTNYLPNALKAKFFK